MNKADESKSCRCGMDMFKQAYTWQCPHCDRPCDDPECNICQPWRRPTI